MGGGMKWISQLLIQSSILIDGWKSPTAPVTKQCDRAATLAELASEASHRSLTG